MAALMFLAGWPAPLGSAVGFAVGAVVSYGLNRRYTFESDRAHRAAAPRHALTVGSGWVLNTAGVALLHGPLGWPVWVAQVLSTGVVLVWHFALSRWWVFTRG
jgi:putative flippase GtrA